ncbi:MAG: DUF6444 domain-containing protein [Propionibacteriaceae bacterium]|jgi:cell division protein FtsB|nr:DUF6444 domain-containing protein [Propionibacteriaceae bacterium]
MVGVLRSALESQQALNAEQQVLNEGLQAQNEALRQRVLELKARVNADSSNWSRPLSTDGPDKPVCQRSSRAYQVSV